jgi:hypothetical protein
MVKKGSKEGEEDAATRRMRDKDDEILLYITMRRTLDADGLNLIPRPLISAERRVGIRNESSCH